MNLIPNVWATVVGGLFYFVFGGVWYAGVMGKTWQAGLKLSTTEQDLLKKNFPWALFAHLISGILTAYVIGRIVYITASLTFFDGVVVGLWCWLGFSLTTCVNAFMFERRASSVFWLNTIFYFIAFAVIGGIVAVWR